MLSPAYGEHNDTSLVQCIYASAATTPFDHDRLTRLLDSSRANNARHDVTGMLLYHEGSFFQVLEGERHKVESLFNHIKDDPRHSQVIKLVVEEVDARRFAQWTMGYAGLSAHDFRQIEGLNDFFGQQRCFTRLEPCRARILLEQFHSGRWRQHLDG